ncbi:metallophosphoesterase family protein [Pleomorphomonas carboxyditropha]|uniref:Metallophosphatase n=1 Tax=Pleomorphomonas carboxyditropha TaxID=2023338 RepID=A0A2G9WXD0_9HYPH|nr:metallophosphoesterase [Pleomorphomonas carboxyditropha]PIO99358.1 metallophosphatase [Pleomorphomonas carboxyditropha]
MFRLIHISDLHLGPLPATRIRDLASKRILGYVNWRRNRSRAFGDDIEAALIAAIAAERPDHVAVTGDLVNIALAGEYVTARAFLGLLGPDDAVSAVPGNHDAYVPGAARRAREAWAAYMTADAGEAGGWPYVRRRGDVAIVGASSAVATGPFMATGSFSEEQEERLSAALDTLGRAGLCRVVLIHHPPVKGATAWHKRLSGASRFRKAIARHGAELILHGHTHQPTRLSVAGPKGDVPVIGVSAATQRPDGSHPAAGFNLFDIEKIDPGFRIRHRLMQVTPGGAFEETRAEEIISPVP